MKAALVLAAIGVSSQSNQTGTRETQAHVEPLLQLHDLF